jgi:UDP-N-acetylmuramoylalanine--D-glutamate ligase
VTYLTGNHLDRYASREAYYDTKWELVKRTEKAVILNGHGGDLRRYAKGRKETPELLWTDQSDEELAHFGLDEARLLGAHNQDNIAVAVKLAREAGWPASAIEAMREFPGLPHRMENHGWRQKILFVNDSKATTMESVKTAALGLWERMDRKTQLVLFLGGRDKNLPWNELADLKRIQKLKPVFFGECGSRAREQSGLEGEVYPSLKAALGAMHSYVMTGDTVLLSPGGTSLDEFKNFEERGRYFAEAVRLAYP